MGQAVHARAYQGSGRPQARSERDRIGLTSVQHEISLPVKPPERNGGVALNVLELLTRFPKKRLHPEQRGFVPPRG